MKRLHNSPYILNTFLSEFPELVMMKGGNLNSLCQAVDLPVECVMGNSQLIPFDKFISLLEETSKVLNYPKVSLDLASRQGLNIVRPLLRSISKCRNLKEALEIIIQSLEILVSGVKIRLELSDELLEIYFDVKLPRLYHRRQFQTYLLANSVTVIRSLLKRSYPIRGCYFTRAEHSDDLKNEHARYFSCPVAFDAKDIKLCYQKSVLLEPIHLPEGEGYEPTFRISNSNKQFERELVEFIGFALPGGRVSLALVAESYGYSLSTFRRRLKDADISFRNTVNAVRFSQASNYLQSTHYTMSDISTLLGFANASAFTRSYIKWSGITPSQYRASL